MKQEKNFRGTDRRSMMKMLALGGAGLLARPFVQAAPPVINTAYRNAMPPVKIRSIRAIATAPENSNLIVVKVETTEPGLYGLGCATFTQRAAVVVTAINSYLSEFAVGKDVDNIEDMWNSFYPL